MTASPGRQGCRAGPQAAKFAAQPLQLRQASCAAFEVAKAATQRFQAAKGATTATQALQAVKPAEQALHAVTKPAAQPLQTASVPRSPPACR